MLQNRVVTSWGNVTMTRKTWGEHRAELMGKANQIFKKMAQIANNELAARKARPIARRKPLFDYPTLEDEARRLIEGKPLPPVIRNYPAGKRHPGSLTTEEMSILKLAFKIDPDLLMPTQALARKIAALDNRNEVSVRNTLRRLNEKHKHKPDSCSSKSGLLSWLFEPLADARRLQKPLDPGGVQHVLKVSNLRYALLFSQQLAEAIPATDVPDEEQRRRIKTAKQKVRRRAREQAVKPRRIYEEESFSRRKPWLKEGKSRRQWYRERHKSDASK
jgi:hypothetical protein